MNELAEYLEAKTRNRITEKYSLSLRELVNMYDEQLINLSPVYQRNFRWGEEKASKLIESLYLGIPLPPIFVSVSGGKWDIIDGVQRISSILWYFGKLKSENNKLKNPLTLKNLEELSDFNNTTLKDLKQKDFGTIFKFFELRRIDVVLLTSNDTEGEYQLFSRLNTGGLILSSQEIRNFLIVKLNEEFYNNLRNIEKESLIRNVLSVSENQQKEDYIMELLVYFVIILNADKEIKKDGTLKKYFEYYKMYKTEFSFSRERFVDKCISLILGTKENLSNDISKIKIVFEKIDEFLPKKPFKKGSKFSPLIYICVISHICSNIDKKINYKSLISNIQNNQEYKLKSTRGTNVVDQFISGIEIGRNL